MTDSLRVLAVDDEPALAGLIAEYLPREDERFDVETASNAEEGLERLQSAGFDCIISDYDMPQMDGLEFLHAVRSEYPSLPFILLTGKGSEEVAAEAISAGVTDYLQKRSDSSQYTVLANRVVNAIDSYQSQERADTLHRIRKILRDVNQLLVRADTRSEIENGVCRIISEAEPYRLVWIGEHDTEHQRIIPRAKCGEVPGYLDDITITTDQSATGQGPTGRAVRHRELVITQSIPTDPDYEEWRDAALEYGFRSSAAIPLVYQDTLYGVLNVYSSHPQSFDMAEQDLLSELGEDIAHALHRNATEVARRRYEQLVNSMKEAAAIYNEDATFELVNDYIADWYEKKPDELIGQKSKLIPLIRDGESGDVFTELLEGDRDSVSGEIDAEFPDHGRAVLDFRLTPLQQEGDIDGIVGVARDITERRNRERELRTLISNLPGIAYRCKNEEGWPMEVVRGQALELSGYLPEQIENGKISWGQDIIHPEDQDRVWDTVQQAVATQTPFEISYRIETKSGELQWVWERGQHVSQSGSPKVEGFITDITERKEYEHSLTALHDAATDFSSTTKKSEVFDTLTTAADEILDFALVAVDEATDEYLVQRAWSLEGSGDYYEKTSLDEDTLATRSYRQGKTIVSDDLRELEITPADPEYHSALTIPIGDHGTFQTVSRKIGAFDDRDKELAELLVGQAYEALERIERERDLRRERDRFEALFSHFPEPTVAVTFEDETAILQAVNPAFEAVFGYSEEEVLNRPINDLIVSPEQQAEAQYLDQRARDDDLIDREVIRHTTDGPRHFLFRNIPVKKDSDSLNYGVYVDISERIAREKEVRELKERLELAIDGANLGVWDWDMSTDIIDFNENWAEIQGFESAEISAQLKEWVKRVHPDDRETVEDSLEELVSGQSEMYDTEHRFHTASGEWKWIRTIGRIFERDADGEPIRAVGIHLDIDDWKTAEESLREERDRLNEFASFVSHDLRNPLTVARGHIDLAKDQFESEHLDAVDGSLARMEQLITDLLDLARHGETLGELYSFRLDEVASRCWDSVQTGDAELDINTSMEITGDESRVITLLENLMRNAIEHGGEPLTVTIGELDDQNGFYIADDGKGIEAEHRDMIFESGYSTNQDGTGFGLAIVKQIVEAHGWKISVVESESGGARFEISDV